MNNTKKLFWLYNIPLGIRKSLSVSINTKEYKEITKNKIV